MLVSDQLAWKHLIKEFKLTEGCFDYVNDSLTGIDVGNNLTYSRSLLGSCLQDHDLGGLKGMKDCHKFVSIKLG